MRTSWAAALLIGLRAVSWAANPAEPNQPLPLPPGSEADKRSYYPLGEGYYWIYENLETGKPMRMSVVGSFEHFGPSAQYFSGPAYEVNLEKTEVSSYWCIGVPWNLAWILGYAPDGSVVGAGNFLWDYLTGLSVPGGFLNYYSLDTSLPQKPPYLLVKPNPPLTEQVSYSQAYPTRPGVDIDPIPLQSNDAPVSWNVIWRAGTVNVPAYSGPVVIATYNEENEQIEDWYYAQGVGVVKIVSFKQGGTTFPLPVELNLVSYSLVGQTTPAPTIPLRDRLIFAANAYHSLNYSQWTSFYNTVSSTSSPSPADACLSPAETEAVMAVDAFLAAIAQAGRCGTPPSPEPVTCRLLVNGSAAGGTFLVGGTSPTYSILSNKSNLTAFWHGTREGVTDVPPNTPVTYFPTGIVYTSDRSTGVFFTYPSFTAGQAGVYTRSVELRDAENVVVCAESNTVTVNAAVAPVADANSVRTAIGLAR
ncbi:MAG: hypothetical protein JWN34_4504 [Bryobacterales bacterium]|nr:hypothetical protein [Bryobacterales bacterium]